MVCEKKEKVNSFGSCLAIFLLIPVFLGRIHLEVRKGFSYSRSEDQEREDKKCSRRGLDSGLAPAQPPQSQLHDSYVGLPRTFKHSP